MSLFYLLLLLFNIYFDKYKNLIYVRNAESFEVLMVVLFHGVRNAIHHRVL